VASIVVESDKKGGCEERRFDNHSGRIVSSNYVDCEARLADERDSTPSENMRGERMRAILAHSGDRSFWPIGYEFGPFVAAQARTQIFYFSAGFPASAGTNGFGHAFSQLPIRATASRISSAEPA